MPPFINFIFMKKYLLLVLISLLVVSCNYDTDIKGVENSFKQFINSLEKDNVQNSQKYIPFLADMKKEEQSTILKLFLSLNNIEYDLDISKISDNTYGLKINTGDPASPWAGITIPYKKNNEGNWTMAPIIKSVQFIDITPAKK